MNMALWQSIPFACILLPLGSAAMTSVLKGKWARRWTFFVLIVVTTLSAVFTACMWNYGDSYTYMMGHYPAPWGNEFSRRSAGSDYRAVLQPDYARCLCWAA